MGAEGNALAAVDADKGIPRRVEVNGVDRAGLRTLPAADAEVLLHEHAPALALGIGAGRAGRGAGCRIAGKAGPRLEPGRKSAGGADADAGSVPGEALVYDPGAGQGAGVTSDAALHAGSCQDLHENLLTKTARGKIFDTD